MLLIAIFLRESDPHCMVRKNNFVKLCADNISKQIVASYLAPSGKRLIALKKEKDVEQ